MPDNIVFVTSQMTEWIEPELAAAPPIVEGNITLSGSSYPLVRSQPIPHGFRWDDDGNAVERAQFCLNDLSHGKFPPSLRSGRRYSTFLWQLNGLTGRRRLIF